MKFRVPRRCRRRRLNTREEVLVRDSLTPAQVDPWGCQVVAGDWLSVYSARVSDPAELEIDHVVALKEAGWPSAPPGSRGDGGGPARAPRHRCRRPGARHRCGRRRRLHGRRACRPGSASTSPPRPVGSTPRARRCAPRRRCTVIDRAEIAETPARARCCRSAGLAASTRSASATLAHVLAEVRYGGAVAACGLAGGNDLPTVGRAVHAARRQDVPHRLGDVPGRAAGPRVAAAAELLELDRWSSMTNEVTLDELPALAGEHPGRAAPTVASWSGRAPDPGARRASAVESCWNGVAAVAVLVRLRVQPAAARNTIRTMAAGDAGSGR